MRIPEHPTQIRASLKARLARLGSERPMLAASLAQIRKRCGRKSCRCHSHGELHTGWHLTYKVEGNKVSWSGQGQSYEAEIGGPAVPITGDMGGTTVQVTNEGGGLKETYTRDGKVVNEAVTTLSPDGKSITWVSTDPRDGSKVSGTAQKTN